MRKEVIILFILIFIKINISFSQYYGIEGPVELEGYYSVKLKNNVWDTTEKVIQKFDNNGNNIYYEIKDIIGMHHQYYYYKSAVARVRYLRKYDQWNNLIEEIYQVREYKDSSWLNYLKKSYEYNDSLQLFNGNYYWDKEIFKWQPKSEHYKEYHTNGKLKKETENDYSKHAHLPDEKISTIYDENGLKIEQSEFTLKHGLRLKLTKLTKFTYSNSPHTDNYYVKQKSISQERFFGIKVKYHTYEALLDERGETLLDENIYHTQNRLSPPRERSVRYSSEDSTSIYKYKKECFSKKYTLTQASGTKKNWIGDTIARTIYGFDNVTKELAVIRIHYFFDGEFREYYPDVTEYYRNGEIYRTDDKSEFRDDSTWSSNGDTLTIIGWRRDDSESEWYQYDKDEYISFTRQDTLHTGEIGYSYSSRNKEELYSLNKAIYQYVGDTVVKELIASIYFPINYHISSNIDTYTYSNFRKISSTTWEFTPRRNSEYKYQSKGYYYCVLNGDTLVNDRNEERRDTNGVLIWSKKALYELDGKERIVTQKVFEWSKDENTETHTKTHYKYNDANQIIHKTIYINDSLAEEHQMTFHNNTSSIEKTRISKDFVNYNQKRKIEIEYDQWGNLIDRKDYELLESGEEKLFSKDHYYLK